MGEEVCNQCGGSGRIEIRESCEAGHSIQTRLCGCRASLEPIRGRARWWTQEDVETLVMPRVGLHEAVAIISKEMPISEDNYRLIRDAHNMYWPTVANIAFKGDLSLAFSHELREIAKWFYTNADRLDAIDDADAALTAKEPPDAN